MSRYHSHAIPIRSTLDGNKHQVGTGFLIDTHQGPAFVTAAHVPIDTLIHEPTAVSLDLANWPQRIYAVTESGDVSLELYGPRGTTYAKLNVDPSRDGLDDMMIIVGPPNDAAIADLRRHYSAYPVDFTDYFVPDGVPLTAHGYPGLSPAGSWPPDSHDAHGTSVGMTAAGTVIGSDMVAPKGMSGGPVTDHEGRLRGIFIGSGPNGTKGEITRIVSLLSLGALLH